MTTNHQYHRPEVGDHVAGFASGGARLQGPVVWIMESPWEGNPAILIRDERTGSRECLMADEIHELTAVAR